MINDILSLRRAVIACAISGTLTFISMIFAFLAFDDIASGESDLAGEWATVQLSFFLTLVFIAITFWLLAGVWVLIGKARDQYGRK